MAIDLNNLAGLLQATNRLAEAEPLYRRALARSTRRASGRTIPTWRPPSTISRSCSKPPTASPRPSRSFAARSRSGRRATGRIIPDVASALNNLAGLLQDTNRLAEAEPLYRRALEIDEASYGPDHPEVATDLNNLAGLLQATNRLAEAEPLYRRALAIDEASLGPDHPDVAIRLNNLAGLLRATNRLGEAEPLFRRALAIFEKSLGADHPNTATVRENLAALGAARGPGSRAERPKSGFLSRLFGRR